MNEAKKIIADLKQKTGIDYSSEETELQTFYDEWLMNGNYHGTFESGIRDLLFVQEDEFDNSDGDEFPDHDEQLCYSAGHYVFFA